MKDVLAPVDLKDRIMVMRNQYVMLDSDVAEIYGVETRVINQAEKIIRTSSPTVTS